MNERVLSKIISECFLLTDRRCSCSCSSNIRRRSLRLLDTDDLYFVESSGRFVVVVIVVSNAFLNSPTRPADGRSITLVENGLVLPACCCCCSNRDRRSSMNDDDDDERFGGCGRSSSTVVVVITLLVTSRDRLD